MKCSSILAAAMLSVASAENTTIPPVLAPIANEGTFKVLLDAIVGTSVLEDPDVSLPITVFGPTDTAFDAVADFIKNATTEQVTAVLKNHIISDVNVTADKVVSAGCLEVATAGGLMLGINYDGETVTVNGVTVSSFDVGGDYGVLHGLDAVLLGDFVPCPVFQADFTPITEKGIYNILLGVLTDNGADAVISANAPATIFGPNDSFLDPLRPTLETFTQEQTVAILSNHVVAGGYKAHSSLDAFPTPLTSEMLIEMECVELEALSGMKLAARYDSAAGTASVNGIEIVDFDVKGDYGVFHGMNGILLGDEPFEPCPLPDFVSQVAWTGEYNTLLGYLDNPVLQTGLESAGPITVFGPNDAAFDAVDLSTVTPAELQMVLGSHVVSGVYTAEDVMKAGCVMLNTIVGTKIRAMFMEEGHDDHNHLRKLKSHSMTNGTDHMDDHDDDHDDHDGHDHGFKGGMIMINEAHVILADIADGKSIFHGLDMVLLSKTAFECPTKAPVVPGTEAPTPTDAPADGKKDAEDSSASGSSLSAILAAVVALAAFAF